MESVLTVIISRMYKQNSNVFLMEGCVYTSCIVCAYTYGKSFEKKATYLYRSPGSTEKFYKISLSLISFFT